MNRVFFVLTAKLFVGLCISLVVFGAGQVYASGIDSHELKYDKKTNLLSITANDQSIYALLNVVASKARFTLTVDSNMSSLERKININLNQVPLERAIDLLLGNTNRVITYASTVGDRLKVERVHIISSEESVRTRVSHDSVRKPDNEVVSQRWGDKISKLKRRLKLKKQEKLNQLRFSEQQLLSHLGEIENKLRSDSILLNGLLEANVDPKIGLEQVLRNFPNEVIKTRILASH